MIHRAVLGSIERFTAVITEHFGGKWYVSLCLLEGMRVLMGPQAILAFSKTSPRHPCLQALRKPEVGGFAATDWRQI
jgi:hypothetical protein